MSAIAREGTDQGDEGRGAIRVAEKGYDANGRKTLNQYTLLGVIARGALSKVKLATARKAGPAGAAAAAAPGQDSRFAIKIYSRRALKRPRMGLGRRQRMPFVDVFAREARNLRALGEHRNVVRLFEYICAPDIDKVYLVLEYVGGGPCLGAWDPGTATFEGGALHATEAHCVFTNLLEGLSHMHAHAMAHGDIKPENILCATMPASMGRGRARYVICDLGSAKQYGKAGGADTVLETSTVGKTHAFFSPEMCGGGVTDSSSSSSSSLGCADDEISYSPFQADLWAAGVTLFAVSSGRLPFWDARGGQPLFDAIISQKVQYPETMSLELRALLDQMLNRSTTRPGISALRQHPWVVDGEGGSRHGNGQNEKKTK